MEFLSEQEFDRRWIVRRTVARTMLRRAAEIEDLVEAANLAGEAQSYLRNLPKKDRCRQTRCKCCKGQSWSQDTQPLYRYGRIDGIIQGPTLCNKCRAPISATETVYKVASGLL